jgi:hypothetical protein
MKLKDVIALKIFVEISLFKHKKITLFKGFQKCSLWLFHIKEGLVKNRISGEVIQT